MNTRQFFTGKAIGFLVVVFILAAIAPFYALNNYIYEAKQVYAAEDYKDGEYIIEGKRVRLNNGLAEEEAAPGSASKIITRYFGNEIEADLNSDSRGDVVFLLTQETGGSGTFFYVVAALNTERGYIGSEAMFLGDRIAPQTTEKGDGKIIVVNYADRAPGQDFSVQPSVGKTTRVIFDPESMQFGIVANDFEGEADPSRMTLTMKTWEWINVLYSDGKKITPRSPNKFSLTFSEDGKFSAKTDCNSMGGSYSVEKGAISFSEIFSTKMFCQDSQEMDFAAVLQNAEKYRFTSKGELIFDLKLDSGTATFK